jgi:hypothetical protein
MSRQRWLTFALAAAGLGLLIITPSGDAASQGSLQQVFVTNFPDPQNIEGVVEVRGPVQLSKQVSIQEIVVPPVQPSDSTRWIDAGVVTLGGFSHVVLSLHGVVKGSVKRPGTIGAVLIPDEATVQEAFDEQGQVHFSLQVTAAGVTSQTPYFASSQPRHTVAFRDYRVWLYNSTDKTVSANLFAYLTN